MATDRCTLLLLVLVAAALVLPAPARAQVGPVTILRSLITNNLAGPRVIHETRTYDFDPEIADRRRVEFEARNGVQGRDLVERLGLGEDGFMEQRRKQQRARDRDAGYFF